MRIAKFLAATLLLALALPCVADEKDKANPDTQDKPAQATSFDQVVDRVTSREQQFLVDLKKYSPLTETYIQNMKPDADLGFIPEADKYFLGRLDMSNGRARNRSYLKEAGLLRKMADTLTSAYQVHYIPLGFMSMIVVDGQSFDRNHYDFKFVRRDFLGDVRCLVIDVSPKPHSGNGRFLGRIWVDDQDYNIIRFNGTYGPPPRFGGHYLHFDSWRLNVQPGIWLPAYVYSEESDMPYGFGIARKLRFKAQTRLWAYDEASINRGSEFSTILVDSPKVQDHSEAAQDATPVQAQREWERMAEDNIVERLQRAGLIAPEGDVDKVLTQVLTNLEVTNKLDIQPEVRARVLLTAPLESFSIGHMVVLSRGLIDVLPDEASLAAVLAHELAHIVLGHHIDTKYAFSDRMIFKDEKVFERLRLLASQRDESSADTKAIELLANSPYKDKLANAGLFLKALQERQKELPNLLHAHLGNSMEMGGRLRMSSLMQGAPQLEKRNVDQIAALPLGGRVHLDIWNDRISFAKSTKVPLNSVREKMSFEVTPVYPYVTRVSTEDASTKPKVAVNSANGSTN
jgi:hypothetical protein